MPSAAGDRAAPRVGVLSLQGDFDRHRAALEALGAEAVRVTLPADLERVEALVLPGGESTTMIRLLEDLGMRGPLEERARRLPVLGTCAGLILLGNGSAGLPGPTFGLLDAGVERNAYGRQVDSFSATIDAPALGEGARFDAVFIRAPRIRHVGPGVEVVARHGAEPVGVRSGRLVGLCFHPELTRDLRFHRWFLTAVAGFALPSDSAPPAASLAPRLEGP